ncbi:MAG: YbaB/EbfC family nucleoid-associated protein [Candidatus Aminicenantes bacterium]|nr:YbaB/EbfC family nucleoid-associated protein [Candidatus Aminicenantes bacterium]
MKGMGNIQKMMKQAQEMQANLQRELAEMQIEGSSGGGMVTVTLDGSKALLSLKIDPEVVDPAELDMLQDLVMAAFNDAAAKVDDEVSQKMGAMGAGLKIPGLF